MQKTFALIFILALIALAPTVSAQERERFLEIQTVTSPGGITAWLVEDPAIPVIAMMFAFRDAGSINDTPDRQGTAMLLSNMLDEGAGPMNARAFQKALADHSITMGFSAGRDDFFGSIKMLAREQDRAFDLLRLAVTAPRFDEDALVRMRNANLARLRSSLSDPEWIAARILNDQSYPGHPYAQNAGGTMSGLNAVTTDDLRAYHKTHLTKDRLVVAVAGAINAQTLAAALDHVFGELPPTAPQTAYPPAVQGVGGTVALVPLDIPQTIIRIHQGGIDRSHPDWVPAQVMNYVLGGSGFGSRLMEEVREKRGLTYGIYTDFSTLTYGDRMSVSTSTKNDSVAEVLNLIKAEWIRMREHDLTAEELDAAKAYLTGSMPLALSSTNAIASMMLDLQLDRLPVDYLDTVADRIRAVTATDVRRVAQSLLKEEDFVTILVGAPKDIAPTITIKELPNVE